MASEYETINFQSTLQDEEFDDKNHNHHHTQNLSRFSVCTSSTSYDVVDDEHYDHDVGDDVDNAMSLYMSQLYIESFDADGEFSDTNDEITQQGLTLSSESENEVLSCYTLPLTPPRRRNMINHVGFASNNIEEAQKGCCVLKTKNNDPSRSMSRSRRRRTRTRRDDKKSGVKNNDSSNNLESDENGLGFMVVTRPKGGKRCLCMDLEEVKACRDLGFELEHEKMFDKFPSYVSFSNSTFDTSSGGNSPIPNWRISSPGDDPKDVKARLKVWAQVVALVSTSKYGT
ncbi:hypothetical protein Lal_00003891 [Lupinus albus]|uniref:Uncharacterized protein n=1 Tax=Lupinus albus TaxID=3870 RepID=A0A6A4NX69_LUPAL|nr:hypothetical protein Lalb_Chr15g0077851 [Lupinus albus]KAF1893976.1 hypothetical protein Lal_00003891 [Lupinus albus]